MRSSICVIAEDLAVCRFAALVGRRVPGGQTFFRENRPMHFHEIQIGRVHAAGRNWRNGRESEVAEDLDGVGWAETAGAVCWLLTCTGR